MLEFKPNKNVIILEIALRLLVILGIFLATIEKPYIGLIFLFLLFVLPKTIEIFNRKLYKVKVEEKLLTLYFTQRFRTVEESYYYTELQYSLDERPGTKGIINLEFRLYLNNKPVLTGIGRGFDGWTKDTMFDIVEELKNKEVVNISL
ncbi:hypothetical protein [Flavobacterium wongokense]|uniref:hypothetical protein n=1 Tax=Flavobacterium wongokense TaxID=2910674 RepID=UPI001F1EFE56|nr:hypothetical protein [Flavobacterium sp. WG47]MCF6133455.1 hypothetical protein [Flavobacterium sp. WG47]